MALKINADDFCVPILLNHRLSFLYIGGENQFRCVKEDPGKVLSLETAA